MRYSAPPLSACTSVPTKPAASGDSNSTGHCVVGILRAFKRDKARSAAYRPTACGEDKSSARRIELYQPSRCILLPLPAMGETEMEWRELAKPPRNPREWALKKCDCCADTAPPSLLVMRLSTDKAAASHSSAISVAVSLSRSQG